VYMRDIAASIHFLYQCRIDPRSDLSRTRTKNTEGNSQGFPGDLQVSAISGCAVFLIVYLVVYEAHNKYDS
jgi:hypothetical protein